MIELVLPQSPHSFANKISMSRRLYKDTYFLVEGYSDAQLFKKFANKNKCRVSIIPSKDLAIKVLQILENRNEDGILLVVDADFDHLRNIKSISQNMFYTDTHDIETMIIPSSAFENFLNEFTVERKLVNFEKKKSKNLRLNLIEVCILIGYVRWASIRNKWLLKFKDLDYKQFIDNKRLSLNYKRFLSELIKNSPKNTIPRSVIIYEASQLKLHSNAPWMICCGHDLTETLVIGLKYIFGYNLSKLTRNKLEAMLRLSFEFRFFQKTILYKNLKDWEKNNSNYIIFS